MNNEKLKKGRRGLLAFSTISYFIVFGGVVTYFIFDWLSSPWDWIVALLWLAWVLPQPLGYFLGNGSQMDDQYVETGDPEVFSMKNFKQ